MRALLLCLLLLSCGTSPQPNALELLRQGQIIQLGEQTISIDTKRGTYSRAVKEREVERLLIQQCTELRLSQKKRTKSNSNSYYRVIFRCENRDLLWGTIYSQETAQGLLQPYGVTVLC